MTTISFNNLLMVARLDQLSDHQLDSLHFGVIGFDRDCKVRRFNRVEQTSAGLTQAKVLGLHIFEAVAPCLNNFLVAQRYHDASIATETLDDTVEHMLTFHMRLTPATLRLLSNPAVAMRYLLIQRHT